MARLRRERVTGNEFSDGLDFVQSRNKQQLPRGTATGTAAGFSHKSRSSPRKSATRSYCDVPDLNDEDSEPQSELVPKATPKSSVRGKQIRLAPLSTLSLSRPLESEPMPKKDVRRALHSDDLGSARKYRLSQPLRQKAPEILQQPVKSSKRDGLQHTLESVVSETSQLDPKLESSDSAIQAEIEESVWCGSDGSSESEDELPSPRKLLRLPLKSGERFGQQSTLPPAGKPGLSLRVKESTTSTSNDVSSPSPLLTNLRPLSKTHRAQ